MKMLKDKVKPLAVCLLLLSVSVFACKSKPSKPKSPENFKAVSSVTVLEEEVPNTLELKGTFVPSDKLDVKTDMESKVLAAPALEGQSISMGDPLATLDAEYTRLSLEKSRQELKETEARLEAGLALNKRTPLSNPHSVRPRPLLQRQNLDDVDENEEVTDEEEKKPDEVANEEEKKPEEENSESSPQGENVDQEKQGELATRAEETAVDRIKAEIALLEKKLESESINSGISGYVSRKNITEGSLVNAGEILYQIVKIDPVLLSVFVSGDQISQIQKGDRFDVYADEIPDQTLSGEVVFVAPEPDAQNKNYEVKISVANTALKLKGGMNGKIYLPLSEKKKALQLPVAAVLQKDSKGYVYIIDKDVASKKEVVLGQKNGDKVEVKKGLKAGDKVVLSGLATMVDEQEYIKGAQ